MRIRISVCLTYIIGSGNKGFGSGPKIVSRTNQAAGWSAVLGRDVLDAVNMRGNLIPGVRHVHGLAGWWPLAHRESRPPFGGRTYRSRRKAAAAVRADIRQPCLHAVRAERALEGADTCFQRMRRQVAIATFTVGPEFECHRPTLLEGRPRGLIKKPR